MRQVREKGMGVGWKQEVDAVWEWWMGGKLRGVQMDAESCARWRGMFVPCSLPLSISLLNSPSCAASPPLLTIHLTTSTWLCASTLCNVFVWIVDIVRQTVCENFGMIKWCLMIQQRKQLFTNCTWNKASYFQSICYCPSTSDRLLPQHQ